MINIILFGPPGSGKGTQSAKLEKQFGLVHLSTGDIFRKEIKQETSLGKKVKSIIQSGQLVPDELVMKIIHKELDENQDAKGFIFDGFPRTVEQAKMLKAMLEKEKLSISTFISLEVEEAELIDRLILRGARENRIDDTVPVIKERIKVFDEKTAPLREFYKDNYKYTAIDGMQKIDAVYADLKELLEILITDDRIS